MRTRFAAGVVTIGMFAALTACSSDPDATGETEDAGGDVVGNGAQVDGGADSGKRDGGGSTTDAGHDTGHVDGGPVAIDGGVDGAAPDATIEVDSGPVTVDAGVDATVDGGVPDATIGPDSGPVTIDAGVDSGPVTVDAGVDSGPVEIDAGVDSGPVTVDAGVDSGPVEIDAGVDSGPVVIDAGVDAGPAPTCATTVCDVHATCTETGAGPLCTCNSGYSGNGVTCSAVLTGAPGDVVINSGDLTTASPNVSLTLQEPNNLVKNPGAEIGNMSDWTVIANGGSGWQAGTAHLFGAMAFVTSYALDKKSQTIDLTANGYTQAQLDAAPEIAIREWYQGTSVRADDSYYLKIELRTATNAVLASYNPTATTKTTSAQWQMAGQSFSAYGTGLKYVYIEHGGKDAEFWAGNFGAAMDGASVVVGGGVQMHFSNDGTTWSAWQPFAPSAAWTLEIGTGMRTVYVEYKDAAGNVWPAVADKITVQ